MKSKISFKQKEKIFFLLSEIIDRTTEKTVGDNDGARINRVEKGMVRAIMREWNNRATKGVFKAVEKIDSESNRKFSSIDKKNVLAELDTAFVGLKRAVSRRMRNDIQKIYRINKRLFFKRLRVDVEKKEVWFLDYQIKSYKWPITKQEDEIPAPLAPSAAIIVTVIDRQTTKELVRLNNLAIGDHYPKNMRKEVIDIIDNAVIKQGLPKREAGKFLERELSKKLGGFIRTVPKSIRQQGQRSISSYFEGLSATTVTRARSFSSLNLMREAEIQSYVWASVLDERTSTICIQMDGRVFEIKIGVEQMEKLLEMESGEDLKENFGWRRDLSEFNLKEGQKLSSKETARLLAENGVPIVPPAHWRCRSEIFPA